MDVICLGILVADIFAEPIPAIPAPGQLGLTDRFLLGAGGCASNTAACLSRLGRKVKVLGKVGSDLTLEEAAAAARLVGISLLSTLKAEIGNLNKVKRIVKVLGMVNAIPTFEKQPQVINGCSDLMVEVFGENGKHARSSVGVASLPSNIPVEIEMIVELKK